MTEARPGIQGDFRESCVVCMNGTDTALAFSGPRDLRMAGLVKLGVPYEEASTMVTDDEIATEIVRVCASCAERVGLTVGLLAGGDLPNYGSQV